MSETFDRAVQEAVQPRVSLTITLKADGKMDVTRPITDKPLCYKLLIQAAVAIAEYQEEPIITVPVIVPPRTM